MLILILFIIPYFIVGWMDAQSNYMTNLDKQFSKSYKIVYRENKADIFQKTVDIKSVAYDQGYLNEKVPLTYELQDITQTACEENNVLYELALAIMEQESRFDIHALSKSGCYGLMQLNPEYFPIDLSPAENIKTGIGYLGDLLTRYTSTEQAITAYYYGPSDRTSSWYSDEVLSRMEHWETVLSE